MDIPTLRPSAPRQNSKVPGGFDTDDELSPIKDTFDDGRSTHTHSRQASTSWQTAIDDEDSALRHGEGKDDDWEEDPSLIKERELRRRLDEYESSFLGMASPGGELPTPAITNGSHGAGSDALATAAFGDLEPGGRMDEVQAERQESSQILPSPAPAYQTPVAQVNATKPLAKDAKSATLQNPNTSSLETMSSSPTAAAAARTVSRVVSMASIGGYETATEGEASQDETEPTHSPDAPDQSTPTANRQRRVSGSGSPTPTRDPQAKVEEFPGEEAGESGAGSKSGKTPRKRPKYLNHRFASQRSSRSSYTSNASLEGASDLTIGADYAIQSGGGIPLSGSPMSRQDQMLSRTVSLVSMASGFSAADDHEESMRFLAGGDHLDSLAEETFPLRNKAGRHLWDSPPQTPQNRQKDIPTPTDTVINQHVRDLEVPATVAKKFSDNQSLNRLNGMPTPTNKRVTDLTLKEQSSKVDELQKENFKLKLKVYYLDQTLAEKSDESVQAMISENVELKSRELATKKEIRTLRRTIRELEAKVRDAEASQKDWSQHQPLSRDGYMISDLERELTYFRDRSYRYETEFNRALGEVAQREAEKRKLVETLRSISERKSSHDDISHREEIDMYRDLYEQESARRNVTDEENKKIREQVNELQAEAARNRSRFSVANKPNGDTRRPLSSMGERSGDESWKSLEEMDDHRDQVVGNLHVKNLTLEQENLELRKENSAKESMLASRNAERDRLYQEIEDLKLLKLAYGAKSTTGDSILDRSASRAFQREESRTSSQSRTAYMSEAERDKYEAREGELQDKCNKLRLENSQLAEAVVRVERDLAEMVSRKEHDEFRRQAEQNEVELQDNIVSLNQDRSELIAESDELAREVEEAKAQIADLNQVWQENETLIESLQQDLAARDDEIEKLNNDNRMTAEGINKLEADVQSKLRQISALKLEIEENNHELESLDSALSEANRGRDKLQVELDSKRSECAFLREEQDSFVLKINDIETNLKTTQATLRSEQDKAKDLAARLQEERRQREVIEVRGKQDIQKMMSDLNRESTNAKEETRKLKKVVETKEMEMKNWKERLSDMETGLREVLGDVSGSKSSFLIAITKLQHDLETNALELSKTKQSLSEKERLLHRRDALLESHGLESQKLQNLLEKERAARRHEQAARDQWEKSHSHSSRTVSQKDARISELEQGRNTDRKKLMQLEAQLRDQLLERNTLLLSLWSRLSAVCGSDWAHQNSIVGGSHIPTIEVVANMLPGFSKNLLAAVTNIEATAGSFRQKIAKVESDLTKDYQHLESNLEVRIRRLDRIESTLQMDRVTSAANAAPEIAQLRGQNALMRQELETMQKRMSVARSSSAAASPPERDGAPYATIPGSPQTAGSSRRSSRIPHNSHLMRASSTSAVETLANGGTVARPHQAGANAAGEDAGASKQDYIWIKRLNEMENRLKAEREARRIDRNGARQRLQMAERREEELRAEIEREKTKNRAYGAGGEDGARADRDSVWSGSGNSREELGQRGASSTATARSRKEGGLFGRLRSSSISGRSKNKEREKEEGAAS